MTQSTKWPPGSNQPPPWIRMPYWVWWGGRTMIVHLGICNRGRTGIACRPQFLDWNRITLCKRCREVYWKSIDTK